MATQAKRKSSATPLDKLADYMGIEPAFRDARGKVQKTSTETKRALLAAMGVSARSNAEIARALKELAAADYQRKLRPVYVAPADDGPVTIQINLPEAARDLHWRLRLEDGTEHRGHAEPASLPLLTRHAIDGRTFERRKLSLGVALPHGYHRLSIDDGPAEALLVVAPARCWLPPSLQQGKRVWGVCAQLYLLRSETNWGIGDFSDLRRLVALSHRQGADVIGLNPLHAMFLDNPEHASPYSPASRLFLNVLYIDPEQIPQFSRCPKAQRLIQSAEFQKMLADCRSASLVDYTHVTELKLPVLRALFEYWTGEATVDREAFDAFRRNRGQSLDQSCVFHCLRRKFSLQDPPLTDWRSWPEEYRRPESPAVAAFAREHAADISFMAWLEWVADSQLAAASGAAEEMEIGLYRDMAVDADLTGVETWSNQHGIVSGAHVGAPPDIFNPAGQDWGLPPFNPRALQDEGYKGFIDLIRANMRYAGALRIDHVMALQHLYWIPQSRSPKAGAYVRYPLDDLVGILALESHRQRCLVIGEDLGTVPDGFRDRMAQANILSYRVLFFEQNEKTGAFRQPQEYPPLSIAVASNHDLPTIRAWWQGSDISLRERLNLFPDPKGPGQQRKQRVRDRNQLLRSLKQAGLLVDPAEPDPEQLTLLVQTYLAKSNAALATVQMDDLTGEIEPVNLPASLDYPNWRRRLSISIEKLFEEPQLRRMAEMFRRERDTQERLSEGAAV